MSNLLKTFCLSLLFISMSCSAMRCGNVLIREGDYIDKMLVYCVAPSLVYRDVSVLGDRVVYIYKRYSGRTVVITRDSKIEEIR